MAAKISRSGWVVCFLAGSLAGVGGCGGAVSFFNPAFVNSLDGSFFPRTPGPDAGFVLVRVQNETDRLIEFTVTVERRVITVDDDGIRQVDDLGNFITTDQRETIRVNTFPQANASDSGVLFPCRESPVTLVGLGEDLLPTDAAVFIDGDGPGGAPGFGVTNVSVGLNPLSLDDGNFTCGDTIIFRAFRSTGTPGGIRIQSFRLAGVSQPSDFRGPDTFENLEQFQESQVRETEP